MLEVQNFLIDAYTRTGNVQDAFGRLSEQYGIKCNFHPTKPLVILNYDQIESPKMEKIVRECRGLVIETTAFAVVAGCMERFFNMGEALEITGEFDWEGPVESRVKEDGSLMTLFNYEGEWMVKTRGSWADLPMGENLPRWDEMFFSLLDPELFQFGRHSFCREISYVFEMCSIYNQVVRLYHEPTLFLLTMIDRMDGTEWDSITVDNSASEKGLNRPAKIDVTNEFAVREYITDLEQTDGTAEGLVLRDKNGLRIKVKSSTYLAYSRLGNNGNIATDKNLIPLIMANEQDEAIAIFPAIEPRVRELQSEIKMLQDELFTTWTICKDIESQKDFALAVLPCTMSSLLFRNRKEGGDDDTLCIMFRNSSDMLVKIIGG